PRAERPPSPGQRRAGLVPWTFLAVPLALYAMWVIGPMFATVWMSLTNSDGLSPAVFIGLDNYRRLLDDRIFWISFWNNVKWLAAFIVVPTAAGLGLAMLLNRDLPGVRFFKAGFFSPMVLSSVVIANVWSWMYFPQGGLINEALRVLGYDGKPIGWLADYSLVTPAIIAAGVWRQIGYVMLLYLAGLKSVDPALIDASRTDGANGWQTFRNVILPQLQPVTVIVLVISVIDALRAFDLVNLMTRGGPANRSNVLANMMYIEAFNNYNMGYGAAVAVVLALLAMVFIFPYLRYMVRREQETLA
ncbi:MAG: carbohydrate ABC transporter permease, partial [Chloroflexota bacterium]